MDLKSITVKAYRYSVDNRIIEIRRRTILQQIFDRADSFTILTQVLNKTFSDIPSFDQTHDIFWKDDENDFIRIKTSTELKHALKSLNNELIKLHLKPTNQKTDESQSQNSDPFSELHKLIICDGCDGKVVGYRFKCLECSDYDLCDTCFKLNKHPSHTMVRLIKPNDKRFLHLFRSGMRCDPRRGQMFKNVPDHIWKRLLGREAGASGACRQNQSENKEKKASDEENDRNMWNEYLKNWGQAVSNLLDQFGVDAMVDLDYPYSNGTNTASKPGSQKDAATAPKNQASENEETSQQQQSEGNVAEAEKSSVAEAPAAVDTQDVENATKDEATDLNSKDWTVVDHSDTSTPADNNPPPSDANASKNLSPEAKHCLKLLHDMGFTDQDNNLQQLVEVTNGDIAAILDLIYQK